MKEFDYSRPGAYFVTTVTHQRECMFGNIEHEEMQLNGLGRVVDACWRGTPTHFANVELGMYVIMPNHMHGIIVIADDDGRGEVVSPGGEVVSPGIHNPGGETPPLHRPTLGQIVAYFKYRSTKEINLLEASGMIARIWQRNSYEHMIRNPDDWDRIHRYIRSNPSRWADDEEYQIK